MNVSASTYSIQSRLLPGFAQAGASEKQLRLASPAILAAPTTIEPTDVTAAAPDDGDKSIGKQRGVLGLLEAGHFRGVADVRLRINFFDELSARANERAADVARDEAGQLLGELGAQLDDVLSGLEADDETLAAAGALRDELSAAFDDAVEAFATDFDREAFESAIESAFDGFVSGLRGLLAGGDDGLAGVSTRPTDSAGAGSIGSIEDVAGPGRGDGLPALTTDTASFASPDSVAAIDEFTLSGGPTDDPLAGLIDAFEQSFASMLAAITETAALPDPAPPRNGNGVAYAKFLAQYDALRDGDRTLDERG